MSSCISSRLELCLDYDSQSAYLSLKRDSVLMDFLIWFPHSHNMSEKGKTPFSWKTKLSVPVLLLSVKGYSIYSKSVDCFDAISRLPLPFLYKPAQTCYFFHLWDTIRSYPSS